jgi:hypothetical protein
MEPRKWGLNMIEPQEKYGDGRPANDFFCIDCQPKLNATQMRFRGTSIGGSILAVHPYTSLSIDRPTYLSI